VNNCAAAIQDMSVL